jgi:hypothetical protein
MIEGKHIPYLENVPFRGSILFASKNAFMNRNLSRRDDMISLCYLLSFLLTGTLSWIGDLDDSQYF